MTKTFTFQIKALWSDRTVFECELEAALKTESYSLQLGAAVKLAVKAGANLADAYLAGANLAGAYLAGANLARANLAGANLADAYLADAYLADAYLAGANLAGAYLAGAYLARANLADANLADANLAGANLADANLADANLAGAYLAGAYLAGANLARANGKKLTLVGKRPAFWCGPIGSRQATAYAYLTDAGIYIRTGCFFNTLDAFKAAVSDEHGDNEHGKSYAAFIQMAEAHFAIYGDN